MKKTLLFSMISSVVLLILFTGCSKESDDSTPTMQLEAPPVATGSVPLLLIRLQYNNIHFRNSALAWSNKIFGAQTHQLNHYYYEVSYGNFSFTRVNENEALSGDGIVTITLNKNHPDSGSSSVIHPDLKEAVEQAALYLDFALYDTDSNAHITPDELQLMFIVAGDEDAYSVYTSNPSVWAHQSCVSSFNTPIVNGVSLMECTSNGNYSLFGERHGNHDATIGIIAHELGHAAFALPDLYDTAGNDSAGIGLFGLMGYGNWGQINSTDLPGNTPVHLCAWSKITNGWAAAQTLSGVTSSTVDLNETASEAYNVIKIPITSREYFLLENRGNSGYDRGMSLLDGTFEGGLALWHIDEEIIRDGTLRNSVNADETHKGVDLEEANMAELDESNGIGHEKNLYYAGNSEHFDPLSSPNSDSYTSSGSSIYVENISTRGALMRATVTNPN